MAEKVTKLQAMERQLREAIRLHFERRDPISTHTLASAACELAADLARSGKKQDKFLDIINPARMKEAMDILRRPQNFFKHADRDHSAVLDFDPIATVLTIARALCLYENIVGKPLLPEAWVYVIWLAMKHPAFVNDSVMKEKLLAAKDAKILWDADDFKMWRGLIDVAASGGMK